MLGGGGVGSAQMVEEGSDIGLDILGLWLCRLVWRRVVQLMSRAVICLFLVFRVLEMLY